MRTGRKPAFITLLLLISFASVNAVLFTPALPQIANFFAVTEETAQQTITWYLIGYTLGQLLYGPIANRFGRKPAIYAGVSLQIFASFMCIYAGTLHSFTFLVFSRFLLALGAGVGLKMAFTLVNECYTPQESSKKLSYLALAFAITPGLGVALGGWLTHYYDWTSCFYAGAVYGLVMMMLACGLPETLKEKNLHALEPSHLWHGYRNQFKNFHLVMGGMLMGMPTCFVYSFAALAPFIAIDISGMSSAEYGSAVILPAIGLILGSLTCAQFATRYSVRTLVRSGMLIATLGAAIIYVLMHEQVALMYSLFLPMVIVYFGLSFIMPNASAHAMSFASDKAHGSAVMNFINMASGTLTVLLLGFFQVTSMLLPTVFLTMCVVMFVLFRLAYKE